MRPWLVLALVLVDDGPHQPLAALGARDAVVVGGGWWVVGLPAVAFFGGRPQCLVAPGAGAVIVKAPGGPGPVSPLSSARYQHQRPRRRS